MNLNAIKIILSEKYPLKEILSSEHISGVWGSLKSALISSIFDQTKQNVFAVFSNTDDALKANDELKHFLEEKEVVFLDRDDITQRIKAIQQVIEKESSRVFVGSVSSFYKETFSNEKLNKKMQRIKLNSILSVQDFSENLVLNGYSRVYNVEAPGEFSIRGGIVDIFPPNDLPIRIELDDDKIVSIRTFDVVTQRSISNIQNALILPFFEENESSFFALDNNAIVIFCCDKNELPDDIKFHKKIFFSQLPSGVKNEMVIQSSMPQTFYGDIEKFSREIQEKKHDVFVVSKQSSRIKELMPFYGENIRVVHDELFQGFIIDNFLEVYTDKEIFGQIAPRRKYEIKTIEIKQDEPLPFKEGDFVVHKYYGIGVFRGIKKECVSNVYSDYLFIQYAGNDCLFVPINKMGLISKYSAPTEKPPKLNKLGTSEWLNTKTRVKKSIKDMTKELAKIYSNRQMHEGISFPKDSHWQKEFEEAFQYEETPDQKRAIEEVKNDMENFRPMDRLLCGDVGFGKTEVALRAAFKAVDFGKQVCVLTPTTILAEQHFLLFKERFAPFPFKIEMLSRFRDKNQQKEIIEGIKDGSIDIVIGTHRLLQNDVVFKDLGLLIIDEEQRFGVSHKEKIKKLKTNIDVLSMSATPIPRTLYMALSGIWDMSVIETPPPGRDKVQTFVLPWDKKIVKDAIEKEMERGGQIFYVHNRVESIDKIVKKLYEICPNAKIVGAHGRMNEKALEKIMMDFSLGKFDVLVCTTIIESGLDMPNVNTIIVESPQNMGLSTLYQLRGRVGRSNIKAYAYFLYDKSSFTEKSIERLNVIKSYTDLGSGQKIAMKDLEIRGAGNVLGAEQHGHMASIGFDLYCEILNEVAMEAKGKKPEKEKEIDIDLKLNAYLPEEYIEDEYERVRFYKKLNKATDEKSLSDISEEMKDRFGSLPTEVRNLFSVVRIKIKAKTKNIERIYRRGDKVFFINRDKSRKIVYIDEFSEKEILSKVFNSI